MLLYNRNWFLLPFCAPAGSAAGLKQDDGYDVSDGELITGSDTELPLDCDQIQSKDQSYPLCVALGPKWGGSLSRICSHNVTLHLITPGLEVAPNLWVKF